MTDYDIRIKAFKVINSCVTLAQLEVAEKFCKIAATYTKRESIFDSDGVYGALLENRKKELMEQYSNGDISSL